MKQTLISRAFTVSHVVFGTCKVKVVRNAFEKQVEYTLNHPYYHKVSYFEFLKSLVQIYEKRSDIFTVSPSLYKKCPVVHSPCMLHDHKEAYENNCEIWPNNKSVLLTDGMYALN